MYSASTISTTPTVSIIIVTWNSTKYIKEVLSNLKLQTFSPAQVLIIDNASDDVGELTRLVNSEFPTYQLIQLENNIGFAAANNLGIKHCDSSDLIALLNPDAFPKNNWLESLVVAAKKYSNYAFFSSRQMQLTPEILDGAGDEMPFWGKPYRRGYGEKLSQNYLKDKPVFSACAAAAMFRRDAIVNVNGFDEDFFCYVEDVDLSFRLQLLGLKCMYVADAVVTHVGSASMGKRSDFSLYYGQRNMVICFFKNMPLLCLIIFLPFHVLCNLAYIFAAIFLGKFKLVLKAKYDAFAGLKNVLLKRKYIQQTKKISSFVLLRIFKYSFFKS